MKAARVLLAIILALGCAVPCGVSAAGETAGKWVSINTNGLNFQDVNCIALDPQHPDTVYAGTGRIWWTDDICDIFKSTDGGSSWKAMNVTSNGMKNVRGIDDILVDPSNPLVVFARVFCSSSEASYTTITRWNLFKSTDGALTWSEIDNGFPTDEPILCLALDPTKTLVVYVGTGNGLFQSRDGGTTWKKINDGLKYGSVDSLVIDSSNPSLMYGLAALSTFKSSDGGFTWNPTGSETLGDSYVHCLALDPADHSTVYVGTDVGLFKSDDAGTTWIRTGSELCVDSFVIDSSDSSTIYVCSISDGVSKSTDGGLTWSEMNHGLEGTGWAGNLVQDPSNTSVLYIYADNKGILKSTDGGLTWNAANKGLEKPLAPNDGFSVSLVGVDPSNSSILYISTSSGLFKTTGQGTTWHSINDGLRYGGAVTCFAIDPLNTSVLYATLMRVWDGTNMGLFKSMDGGSHWSKSSDVSVGRGWVTSLAIDPSVTSTIYAGVYGGISKSTDGGTNWAASAAGLDAEETMIFGLAVDPTNTSVVYAGNIAGGGFKSVDGGASWITLRNGLAEAGTTSCILVDPSNTSVLYIGVQPIVGFDDDVGNTGVFKSTDAGSTWAVSNQGLGTTTIVTALAMDPTAPSVLYAATWGGGVFRSSDAGDHWEGFSKGLTTTFVNGLFIGPKPSPVLYACTSDGNISKWPLGASPSSPPSVPADLTATPSVTDIRLDWSAAAEGAFPLGGYCVYRSTTPGSTGDTPVATVDATVTNWTDKMCNQGVAYYYAVTALDNQEPPLSSDKSSEVTATLVAPSPPSAPGNLVAAASATAIRLSWSPSAAGTAPLDGYAVFRSTAPKSVGDTPVATVSPTTTSWTDTTCQQEVTYYYAVAAFDNRFTERCSEVSAKLLVSPRVVLTLTLQLADVTMLVSGSDGRTDTVTLDAAPILGAGNRTLVPIRAVVEALGGMVDWDAATRTATVIMGSNRLQLMLGKNTALFNGTTKQIDTDPKVLPLIINGRMMLPLRFVVESLGANVAYEASTKTITITYVMP